MRIKYSIGLVCLTLMACTPQENNQTSLKVQKEEDGPKTIPVLMTSSKEIEPLKEIHFPPPVKIDSSVSVRDSVLDFMVLCERFSQCEVVGNSKNFTLKIKSPRGLYVIDILKNNDSYETLIIDKPGKNGLLVAMDQHCDGFQVSDVGEFIFIQNDTCYPYTKDPVELTSLNGRWLEKSDSEYLKVIKYLKEILNSNLTSLVLRKQGLFLF